ncbi:MAG: PilZ domain-containing protein [bacterium]
MTDGVDGRHFARFILPVLIEAPALSEVPLVPEDLSAGGFSVIVTEKPEPDGIVECNLQILGAVFEKCEAKIMRIQENDTDPVTWTIGLSILLSGEERERLVSMVKQLVVEIS